MRIITPAFKDDKDRLITFGTLVLSIFLIFIPSLIVIFIPKDYISESTYEIAKAMFNFEIFLFLISLLFIIPIIGWIAGFFITPILLIWNVVVIIMNLSALTSEKEMKFPDLYRFI